VDYQQFQFGASYHHAIGPGRWVHLGLEHAVVTTFGTAGERAVFPGG
jgi:hypothetical protein